MNEDLFKKISNYIINEVIENSESSMSGFQSVVYYSDILERFSVEIEEFIQNKVMEELLKREEIVDAELDTDGYDVVLYTNYAQNYEV